MNDEIREVLLLMLTKKLVICAGLSLTVIAAFFFFPFFSQGGRSYLTLIVFASGLVGGFVSIQQRVHKVSDDELHYLSRSWPSVLLVPIYGGIFALVLYVAILGEIISGSLFPEYDWAGKSSGADPSIKNFKQFFTSVVPKTGQDVAKMVFWSFLAGFSERLVPQIIKNVNTQLWRNLPAEAVRDGEPTSSCVFSNCRRPVFSLGDWNP